MGRKIATIAAVALIASTATIGCGSTIQKVSGTINNVVQTDEFANAADSISDTVWGLMTTVADAVCDFCKNAFGDGDTSKPETPDAGNTETSNPGSSETPNAGTTENPGAGSTEMAVAGGTDTSSAESSGEAQTKPAESEENKD